MTITVDQLVGHYPSLYHMAERDVLSQIQTHGLLSTTAILDLLEIEGCQREQLERGIRRSMTLLSHAMHGRFTLRDQKPMSLPKLESCLQDGMSAMDWLRLLNRKVFFWVERGKVESLLNAREYHDREHIVLEIDTRSIAREYTDRLTLAAMNTGTTNPFAHPRGASTILPLIDYPYEDRRSRGLRIAVECCVDYSVPNVMDHIRNLYIGSKTQGLVNRNDLLY